MSNNEPDYKDNLAFDAEKSKNKDIIIGDFVDLIHPDFITTEKECWNNINKVQTTLNELKKYQLMLVDKLAQIRHEKVIRQSWEYDYVLAYDYHVAKDVNSCSVDTVVCDDLVEFDCGNFVRTEILEDYTNDRKRKE